MSGAEVELKLALPRAAVAALRRHPALRAAVSGRARTATLAACYFDTPDLALADEGLALRVRRERGRWRQTLKGRGSAAGSLAQRAEDEWDLGAEVPRPPPAPERLAETALGRDALRALRGRALRPMFTTTFARTALPLAFADGTRAEAAIDVGRVQACAAPRRAAALCELELELREGDVARLFELARSLVSDLPLAVESRSKAQRGYGLAAARATAPVHARTPHYGSAAQAGEALSAIVRSALVQIEGNAPGAASAADPEWIHQMRVGVRRLRSALALARRFAADEGRAVADEARWLAEVLGRARDLDVFVGETLPPLCAAAGPEHADALAQLAAGARRHQARAHAGVRSALRSPRYQRLLLALGAFAAALPARAGDDSASAFAHGAMRRRHRQLVRAGATLESATAPQRHAVRIAAKKLRYATEFFTPLYPGRAVARYRDALSGLQDVLGRLNDAAAAATLAATLCKDRATAPALVAGWAAARSAGEERALQRAWRKWRAAKPFWKDDREN